jgi:hypothetical protein
MLHDEFQWDKMCRAGSMHGREVCTKFWLQNLKRPPGRLRCRWEDNIKMYLKEIGLESVDWIHLIQDRDSWWALVDTVINTQFS